MPVQYQVNRVQAIVRLELSDPLDLDQIESVVHELVSDPEVQAGMSILSDHSQLRFTATTAIAKAIPGFLGELARCLGPVRCALVVPSDGSYGMARMTEALTDQSPGELRAFRTLQEAETWLGVSAAV